MTEEVETKQRFFQHITNDGICTGRYSGVDSDQAANKVFSAIYRDYKKKGDPLDGEIRFAIRECTRGSG